MTWEYCGGVLSALPHYLSISMNRMLSAELCLHPYLNCTKAEQPAKLCEKLWRSFMRILHLKSSFTMEPIFFSYSTSWSVAIVRKVHA